MKIQRGGRAILLATLVLLAACEAPEDSSVGQASDSGAGIDGESDSASDDASDDAAIDVTSSTPVAWSPSFNGAVHAIETDGARVIAGGAFSTSVGGARPSIVLMTAP